MASRFFFRAKIHSVRKRALPYRKLKNDFYESLRLTCSGSVLFVPENLYCIDYAVRHMPEQGAVIEIGSFLGMSTCMIAHYLQKHRRGNRFFSCDRWEFEEKEKNFYEQSLGISRQNMKQFVKESFIRNLRFFQPSRLPFTIELFSDEFFEQWNQAAEATDVFGRTTALGGAISFAYVDGNHQLEFVRRDFQHIDRHLAKGGFIFFDDSASFIESGMHGFMREMKRNDGYKLVLKNPNQLWQKIKQ